MLLAVPGVAIDSCCMATIDLAKKFAEQSIKVERVLREAGVTRNGGRVVLVLTMANTAGGVSQRDVVETMALPKYRVSKLVGSLVQAGLLTTARMATNSRIKRLTTTAAGRDLLSRLKSSLQPPRPVLPANTREPATSPMLTFDE